MQNILCPVDGSESSLLAARKAGRLASVHGGKLTLLYVVPLAVARILGESTSEMDELQTLLEQRLEERADECLRDARQAAGAEATVRKRTGHPAREIVEEAVQEQHDLIVMGNRGLGGISQFLGSVSAYVVHHSPVPVLIDKAPVAG